MLKYISIISVLLVLVSLFTGCATTEIDAFTDPEFYYREYSKILVKYNDADKAHAAKAEKLFCKYFNKESTTIAVPYTSVMGLSEENLTDALRDDLFSKGFEALVETEQKDFYYEETKEPDVVTKEEVVEYKNGKKITRSVKKIKKGEITRSPHVLYSIMMLDIRSSKKVWVASSHTSSDSEFLNLSEPIRSLAAKCAGELKQKGVVRKKKK